MKLIVTCVLGKMHIDFYKRMEKAFREEGYQFLFLASNYSTYHYAIQQRCNVKLLRRKHISVVRDCYQGLDDRLLNSMDVKIGLFNLKSAVDYYKSIYELLENINQKHKISLALAFQNARTEEMSLHDFAANHSIDKLFFEYSNMPGKLFCDREGSNKKSELYLSHNRVLDQFDCPSDEEYNEWKKSYLKIKFKQVSVPQAQMTWHRTPMEEIKDVLSSLFITHVPFANKNTLSVIKTRLNRKFNRNALIPYFADFDAEKNKKQYIFFPLQVSADTQIIINSDIGLIEALQKAVDIARKANMKLVIKPHPAESNKVAQGKILDIARKNHCVICNNNTFDLIQHAYKVITINSTVGLESMILGTPVEVLADAFYKNFSYEQLKKYLLRYLVNIELFSNNEIKDIQWLLDRAKIS